MATRKTKHPPKGEQRRRLTLFFNKDARKSAADALKKAAERFKEAGIGLSVFVNAAMDQVEAAHKAGADIVELHTGPYSHAEGADAIDKALDAIETAAHCAWELGLDVHAGHGLNYHNVERLLRQVPVEKVNIGHSIVSRAVFTGLENAVRDMKNIVASAG